MAYNYFPQTFQMPAYYPQQQMTNPFPNQNQQQSNNGMIWVVGEAGADSYLVAPGQTVELWDSTAPVIYLKAADNLGRTSKKIFDYTERNASPQGKDIPPVGAYASKEDVDYLKGEIESLKAKFEVKEGSKK